MRRIFVFAAAAGALGLAALTAGCPSSTATPATSGKGPTEKERAAQYQKNYSQRYSGGGQQGGGGAAAMPPGPGRPR